MAIPVAEPQFGGFGRRFGGRRGGRFGGGGPFGGFGGGGPFSGGGQRLFGAFRQLRNFLPFGKIDILYGSMHSLTDSVLFHRINQMSPEIFSIGKIA